MPRKGEGKHKVRGAARRRMHRTENGPAVRSGWAWPGLTRHGYGVGMHLASVVVFLGAVDAMPVDSEESAVLTVYWHGLAAAAVDFLLPLAASAAISGAGALVAGSVTRGVAGQPGPLPAANRTHTELKNDLNKTGKIYVQTCGICKSDP